MSDGFHEIALKSILFKGRNDIYFCYLKAERIAHVLALLSQNFPFKDSGNFGELVTLSNRLPHAILHFAAGEIDASLVLADILSLLSWIRLSATQGYIRKENTIILCEEYEAIARKIAAENHPSPFVSSKDFSVEEIKIMPTQGPFFAEGLPSLKSGKLSAEGIKDINKGHKKTQEIKQSERMSLILDFVRKHNGVSIKEIAASVKGCSEKTIQRELGSLIEKGLIERKGERRWSIYSARPFSS
ncbi:MAG: Uncharacterized protein G01um101456_439 [Parcubacteria group bacterium Gr01-1014_56]|nr:MAG: Uncharacterized protein G01um101456_439 [Parcubacteria group bacterium Gr01-1014_56]